MGFGTRARGLLMYCHVYRTGNELIYIMAGVRKGNLQIHPQNQHKGDAVKANMAIGYCICETAEEECSVGQRSYSIVQPIL